MTRSHTLRQAALPALLLLLCALLAGALPAQAAAAD